jgi:hypothetical protein
VALCRRRHHGGGGERSRLHGHRRLWQAGGEVDGGADPAAPAVEIRLQVDQVDRQGVLRQGAPGRLLGAAAGQRIRLLGECESGGAASALEPGHRAGARHRRANPNPALQWLWRRGGKPL